MRIAFIAFIKLETFLTNPDSKIITSQKPKKNAKRQSRCCSTTSYEIKSYLQCKTYIVIFLLSGKIADVVLTAQMISFQYFNPSSIQEFYSKEIDSFTIRTSFAFLVKLTWPARNCRSFFKKNEKTIMSIVFYGCSRSVEICSGRVGLFIKIIRTKLNRL